MKFRFRLETAKQTKVGGGEEKKERKRRNDVIQSSIDWQGETVSRERVTEISGRRFDHALTARC